MRTIEFEIPEGTYWYLAGPMTGYDQYNFPAFRDAAEKLRAAGYPLAVPFELKANASFHSHGTPGGHAALAGDVNLVMHEDCLGVILLPGWEDSKGVAIESFIARNWSKPIYTYDETPNGLVLTQIH